MEAYIACSEKTPPTLAYRNQLPVNASGASVWAVIRSPKTINRVQPPKVLVYANPPEVVVTGQKLLVLAFPYPWLPLPVPNQVGVVVEGVEWQDISNATAPLLWTRHVWGVGDAVGAAPSSLIHAETFSGWMVPVMRPLLEALMRRYQEMDVAMVRFIEASGAPSG